MKTTHAFLNIYKINKVLWRCVAALSASFIIVSFDEKETWWDLLKEIEFYPAIFSSFLIAILIIETVYRLNDWLDSKFIWKNYKKLRPLLQIFCCLLFPLTISVACATLYYRSYNYRLTETVYFNKHFVIIFLMIVVSNLYFMLAKYVTDTFEDIQLGNADSAKNEKWNFVKKEQVRSIYNDTISLPKNWKLQDVWIVFSKNRNVWACNAKEKVIWQNSISQTWSILSRDHYFLCNRSVIVKRNNILNAKSFTGRRVVLLLKNPVGMCLIVAKSRKSAFLKWYDKPISKSVNASDK